MGTLDSMRMRSMPTMQISLNSREVSLLVLSLKGTSKTSPKMRLKPMRMSSMPTKHMSLNLKEASSAVLSLKGTLKTTPKMTLRLRNLMTLRVYLKTQSKVSQSKMISMSRELTMVLRTKETLKRLT